MKTKRKLVVGITSLALVLLMLIGMTMAYLTDQRTVLNLLGLGRGKDENGNTVQAVQISLTEPSFVDKADKVTYLGATEEEDGLAPEAVEVIAENLKPNEEIFKDPTIENVGAESVYLRVSANKEKIDKLAELGLAINEDDFTFNEADGFWYYSADGISCAEFKKGESVQFFVVEKLEGAEDELSYYSMKIPALWGNAEIKTFVEEFKAIANDENALLELGITAQAIQFESYTPTGLSWADSGTIIEVALDDRQETLEANAAG